MLGGVACAGRLPPCPAAGGPAWRELATEHFRLRTDLDDERARSLLAALEQFRTALLTVFRSSDDLRTGRLPVVAVDRGWGDFADAKLEGFFTRALFQPLIVMKGDSTLAEQNVIKHELVHYLTRLIMPVQPRWLSEGLASYFETVEVDPDERKISVGRPPSNLLQTVQLSGPLDADEMMATKGLDENVDRFYATAWLAVHYLMNHRNAELRQYEEALRDGVSPSAAWTRAFGAFTFAALMTDLRSYMDGGQYELLIYPLPGPPAPSIAAHLLADADVHATRAMLFVWGGRGPRRDARVDLPTPASFRARAERELAEALRDEPGHPDARAIAHFELGAPLALEAAQLAARERAGDWMSWLLLAEALRQQGVAEGQAEAAQRALQLAREDPSVSFAVR